MPPTGSTPVSIGQIYAAFAPEAHKLFRAAMHRSRGGTVVVGDLLTALWDLHADAIGEFVPTGWQPAAVVRPDPRPLVPMSNEPALNNWLTLAYRLAMVQAEPKRQRVTVAGLWLTAIYQKRVPALRSMRDVGERLLLAIPDDWIVVFRPPPSPQPVRKTAKPAHEELAVCEQIELILRRWLAVQTMSDVAVRDRELAELGAWVRRIELGGV